MSLAIVGRRAFHSRVSGCAADFERGPVKAADRVGGFLQFLAACRSEDGVDVAIQSQSFVAGAETNHWPDGQIGWKQNIH